MNKRGPSTEPWGTPREREEVEELQLLMLRNSCLLVRRLYSQERTVPDNLNSVNVTGHMWLPLTTMSLWTEQCSCLLCFMGRRRGGGGSWARHDLRTVTTHLEAGRGRSWQRKGAFSRTETPTTHETRLYPERTHCVVTLRCFSNNQVRHDIIFIQVLHIDNQQADKGS